METKTCTKCSEIKSVREFTVKRKRADGTVSVKRECRQCIAKRSRHWRNSNREKSRVQQKAWGDAHKELRAAYQKKDRIKHRFIRALSRSHFAAKYGNYQKCSATSDELAMVFTGYCKACGVKEGNRKLCIDHCHITGFFRGWLCQTCNRILGLSGDSEQRLLALAAFLKRANGVT